MEFEDIFPDNPLYYNAEVDESLLPSWDYVDDLTADNRLATEDYFRFLLRLARHRDPEITNWVLKHMNSELEALALLPDTDCMPFDGDDSPDRKQSIYSWLLKHEKHGLHAILQNTIVLLRTVIDDVPASDIPKHKELFGDKLTIFQMHMCLSLEGRARRDAYMAERVREAKQFK